MAADPCKLHVYLGARPRAAPPREVSVRGGRWARDRRATEVDPFKSGLKPRGYLLENLLVSEQLHVVDVSDHARGHVALRHRERRAVDGHKPVTNHVTKRMIRMFGEIAAKKTIRHMR